MKYSKRGFIPSSERNAPELTNEDIKESGRYLENPNKPLNLEDELKTTLAEMGVRLTGNINNIKECASGKHGILACLKLPPNMIAFLVSIATNSYSNE